jgi:hypothetical protein
VTVCRCIETRHTKYRAEYLGRDIARRVGMTNPTHNYSGYTRALCRHCFWKDDKSWEESVHPVIGHEVGGTILLRCGHAQMPYEGEPEITSSPAPQ